MITELACQNSLGGIPTAVHLVRHDVPLMELAFGLFGAGTQVRSAKGLLEDLSKLARKEKWVGKAGAV